MMEWNLVCYSCMQCKVCRIINENRTNIPKETLYEKIHFVETEQ